MSTHKVNDSSWETLIADSEMAIETYRDKIASLRKSLVFFKKQRETGAPFPLKSEESENTHANKS
jgi:hypothetical protein